MAKKTATKKAAAPKATKQVKRSAWDIVKLARDPNRPNINEYIQLMCSDFIELHGDRLYGDDRGLICGFATIGGEKVVIMGQRKCRTLEENIEANFGMANPEGYRKAMRVMKLAEKYHLPVVSLVDTSGAYPGAGAEERGQAEAIAHNLEFMSTLKTPIVVVVVGEGGSGGALGIAVGDRIMMLENAIYSVISPEGCASILWRDGAMAPTAAEALKLTAPSLLKLGVIDGIIPEPAEGAQSDQAAAAAELKKALLKAIAELKALPTEELVAQRYAKFCAMGRFATEEKK